MDHLFCILSFNNHQRFSSISEGIKDSPWTIFPNILLTILFLLLKKKNFLVHSSVYIFLAFYHPHLFAIPDKSFKFQATTICYWLIPKKGLNTLPNPPYVSQSMITVKMKRSAGRFQFYRRLRMKWSWYLTI